MTTTTALPVLTPKDFASDQDIRWCPRCGDYSILAQMKKVLPTLETPRENFVFISGIGCAARFPYYLDVYGMHSIHGRAPAFATGLKVSRPELSVWVISGDGDALSIGGNHLIHAIRRNVDINIILFNNQIYGLTKGQYSPTSPVGKLTKSTPMGSVDTPLKPLSLAISAEATFVARSIDVNIKHLEETLTRAAKHRGTSFVEVYQDCNVFNHKAFDYATDKTTKDDTTLALEHGKPMIFGSDDQLGLRIASSKLALEVVTLGHSGITEDDIAVHDETDRIMAHMLAEMQGADLPVALGVLYCDPMPSYEAGIHGLAVRAGEQATTRDLNELLRSGHTWTVEE